MSLSIDVDKVAEILLADGQWYTVVNHHQIAQFDLDTYEYHHGYNYLGPDVPGFWAEIERPGKQRQRIYGPLSSIIAVRVNRTQ